MNRTTVRCGFGRYDWSLMPSRATRTTPWREVKTQDFRGVAVTFPSCPAALLAWLLTVPAARAEAPVEQFEKHVRPLLAERYVKCHGPAKQSGYYVADKKV